MCCTLLVLYIKFSFIRMHAHTISIYSSASVIQIGFLCHIEEEARSETSRSLLVVISGILLKCVLLSE